MGATSAEFAVGRRVCSFEFPHEHSAQVERLIEDLQKGSRTVEELAGTPQAAALLEQFEQLDLLVEGAPPAGISSGLQLFREVRRICDRVVTRSARSRFLDALLSSRATSRQLIGYTLEYFCLVYEAPALIAPALATAHCPSERMALESFLRSELGHDRFLRKSLRAVGIGDAELERHASLPSTQALIASLGVYARQDPITFRCGLFLFERSQDRFIDAFDARCRELELPEEFSLPLRKHAELNAEGDHEDISRSLMEHYAVVTAEACTVVKRHVSLLVEMMVWQEDQILDYYGNEKADLLRGA